MRTDEHDLGCEICQSHRRGSLEHKSQRELGPILSKPSPVQAEPKGKGTSDGGLRDGQGLIILDKGNYLKVLDTWKNIGPILDAALVDTDGSGQVSLPIASGKFCSFEGPSFYRNKSSLVPEAEIQVH